jgi:hypothetical protein
MGVKPSTQKRNEANRPIFSLGMKRVERLEPEQRELDRVFPQVGIGGAKAGRLGREPINQIPRTNGLALKSMCGVMIPGRSISVCIFGVLTLMENALRKKSRASSLSEG